MLETLLERPFSLNRHQKAPLLKERELFLRHLQQQGTSRFALRNLSGELIHVVRLLRLEKLCDTSQEEIHKAAQRWARQQRSNPKARSYGNSASFFIYAAKKWFRFHGRLKLSSAPRTRFADQLSDFARYMTEEQGLSPHSVQSHCWKTSKFLAWFEERHRSLVRVIRPSRVLGVFERLGYCGEAAQILTRLTTYEHQLPQGPPTSPAIANLCIPRIDARLSGVARAQQFDQGRFVDDMTVSGSKRLAKFARLAGRIVEEDGFSVKQGPKGKLMLQNEPQTVTGLGLNFRVNVERQRRQEILQEAVEGFKSGLPLNVGTRGRLDWVKSANPRVANRLASAVRQRPNKTLHERNRVRSETIYTPKLACGNQN